MCAPDAPAPPDPKQTAAASTSTNVGTAIANAFLGNVNQVTPTGSLTYDQTGSYKWHDPYTGKNYNVPTFTATQTLSPEEQKVQDQQEGAKLNLSTLANNQSAFLNDYLGKPVDLSSKNIENFENTHFADDFNQQWDRNLAQLQTRLANSGVMPGSTAYTKALSDFNTSKANAYDNMQGNQYGLAQQSILAQRNQPINEITALLSGSQVDQPNFVNANEPTIPTTDTAGIINSTYQDQLAAWQQQQAQQQQLLGGLFGLGAAGIFKWSDRRLKEDVHKVGKTKDGQNLYSYRYRGDPTPQIGLMAQEVEKRDPGAVVTTPSGFKAVNYDRALGGVFGMGHR